MHVTWKTGHCHSKRLYTEMSCCCQTTFKFINIQIQMLQKVKWLWGLSKVSTKHTKSHPDQSRNQCKSVLQFWFDHVPVTVNQHQSHSNWHNLYTLLRRVAYPCLKARKARCLRNTELRAMQRKQGWKLDGSGFWKKNKQQRRLFMRYHHSQPKTG